MRRSGELQGGPQDLSKNPSSPISETAENLSMKKSSPSNSSINNNNNNNNSNSNNNNVNSDHRRPPSHPGTPQTPPHLSVSISSGFTALCPYKTIVLILIFFFFSF